MTAKRHATGLSGGLLAGLVLLAGVCPASADCDSVAQSASCRHRQNVPALQYARSEAGHIYGALAYSKRDGAYGFSTGFADSESANEYALTKCSQRGRSCYVVISFSNLCASVAADDAGGVFWGTAGTRQEAQRQSMLYCRRDGEAATCQIKVWACSMP
jgi:hypothetical protein